MKTHIDNIVAREWLQHLRETLDDDALIELPAAAAVDLGFQSAESFISTPATTHVFPKAGDSDIEAEVCAGSEAADTVLVRVVHWHPSKMHLAPLAVGAGSKLADSDIIVSMHRRVLENFGGNSVLTTRISGPIVLSGAAEGIALTGAGGRFSNKLLCKMACHQSNGEARGGGARAVGAPSNGRLTPTQRRARRLVCYSVVRV